MKVMFDEIKKSPFKPASLDFLEMSREETHEVWWHNITTAFNNPVIREAHFTNNDTRTNLGFCWSYLF